MGAVTFSIDERLIQFFTRHLPVEIFVETGTFKGESLRIAKPYFKECHSVELSPHYFQVAAEAFKDEKSVVLYEGLSPDILAREADRFGKAPTLFWLDAHWCVAENTAGENSQSPLLGELEAIGKLHPESVILIDDARLYLCAPPKPHRFSDWPEFHSIIETLFSLSKAHRLMICNDVIIFAPAKVQEELAGYAHEHGVDWLNILLESRKPPRKKKKKKFRFWRRG